LCHYPRHDRFQPAGRSAITLGGSEILIDKDLTIAGPGANLLSISGMN
jgi:hypothetical protein